MPQGGRHFTIAEAKALLPEVIPLLEDLQAATAGLGEIATFDGRVGRISAADGHFDAGLLDPGLEEHREGLVERSQQSLRRIARMGIEVKDPARGLIDFPHDRHGETVYLCYHLGERDIGYWHRIEDGFAGRVPIE